MSNSVKEQMKPLWGFADNPNKRSGFANTQEYKAGVQDAINRLEFLWLCHKYGSADEDSWLAMDSINEGIELVKLILEESV